MGWKRSITDVLYFIFLVTCAFEVGPVWTAEELSELSEFHIDSYSKSDVEDGPNFVEGDDLDLLPKIQYKTAEIADAVMGTEMPVDPVGIESLIPKKTKDIESDFGTACDSEAICGEHLIDGEESLTAKNTEVMEPVTLGMVHVDMMATEEQNSTEAPKQHKVTCDPKNTTGTDSLIVQILNASQDLMELLNANSSECSLVLFYTTWCQFSANLAPHFNALPRVFPAVHFLALDASQHSSLSTRFGTVAVPNILLFQGAKPMARFNQSERTLETLTSFITNQTGLEVIPGQTVREEDYQGPLPSIPVKSIDWLLVFSVLFISAFTIYAILRTDSIRWLIPGQEHEHQD